MIDQSYIKIIAHDNVLLGQGLINGTSMICPLHIFYGFDLTNDLYLNLFSVGDSLNQDQPLVLFRIVQVFSKLDLLLAKVINRDSDLCYIPLKFSSKNKPNYPFHIISLIPNQKGIIDFHINKYISIEKIYLPLFNERNSPNNEKEFYMIPGWYIKSTSGSPFIESQTGEILGFLAGNISISNKKSNALVLPLFPFQDEFNEIQNFINSG